MKPILNLTVSGKDIEEGFEDMHRRRPDIRKISELTGYAPKYDLEDIILDVAAYQRQRLTNDRWMTGGHDR